jgi:hypothetical protein
VGRMLRRSGKKVSHGPPPVRDTAGPAHEPGRPADRRALR